MGEKSQKPAKTDKNVAEKQYVTKDTMLGDVVSKHPRAAFVMMHYGLHCIGCHVSVYETIEQGCQGHGMPPEIIDKMVDDINEFIAAEEKVKVEQATAEPR